MKRWQAVRALLEMVGDRFWKLNQEDQNDLVSFYENYPWNAWEIEVLGCADN